MSIRICLFLFCGLFVWANSVFAQRQAKEVFDIISYEFEIALNDSSDRIAVDAKIILYYPTEIPQKSILDLASPKSKGFGMTVEYLTLDGANVTYNHQMDQLIIDTPKLSAGDTVVVQLSYSGIPEEGLVISKNDFGERTFFSEHWPNRAHGWLSVIDHPQERALSRFSILAPDHYQVVSNGKLIERKKLVGGLAQTTWQMDHPIPAKVMAVGVADFVTKKIDSTGMTTAWVYRSSGTEALNDFSDAPQILSMLTDVMGEYPFSKCDHVESSTEYGGMENAGNIFYPEEDVSGRYDLNPTIAHEIAHQWFGNALSEASWRDVWISEGFATFFEYYFVWEYYGKEAARQLIHAEEAQIRKYIQSHPNATIVQQNIKNLDGILNALTYNKAARMLMTLYQDIGKEKFKDIIVTFYNRFKFKNATTKEFIQVASEVSGQNLYPFFEQWLYQPGLPVQEYQWD